MPTIYRHTIEMGLGVIQRCSLGQYEPLGQSQFLKAVNKVFDFEEVCSSWLDRFFGKWFFIYNFYNFILAGTHDFVKFTHYLYVGTFIKNVSTFIKLSKILTVFFKCFEKNRVFNIYAPRSTPRLAQGQKMGIGIFKLYDPTKSFHGQKLGSGSFNVYDTPPPWNRSMAKFIEWAFEGLWPPPRNRPNQHRILIDWGGGVLENSGLRKF
jgi:hypothetical protein